MTANKRMMPFFIVFLALVSNAGAVWMPLGAPRCEDTSGHQMPIAVTQSSDGFIHMAVGSSPDERPSPNGQIQLYKFDETSCGWRKELPPIVGETTSWGKDLTVALSCDATTMAVGDRSKDGRFWRSFVQVYERQNGKNEWSKKRLVLVSVEDTYGFGVYIQLSCDGNTVVISTGYISIVHIFEFDMNSQEWNEVPVPFWTLLANPPPTQFDLVSGMLGPWRMILFGWPDQVILYHPDR